jgi:dihydroorotase
VELVSEGRRRGIGVTAEACPHHFTLTDESLRTFDANFKMNPPLRTKADVDAVIGGLRDGTITLLATDHAPHAPEKKARELDQAPFGIVGLETLIPITVHGLIGPGHLSWPDVIRMLTVAPAELLGIDKGTLKVGADADVTLIDPELSWTIDPKTFHSKSRNTPYGGWKVKGRAVMAIVGGEVRYELDLRHDSPTRQPAGT